MKEAFKLPVFIYIHGYTLEKQAERREGLL